MMKTKTYTISYSLICLLIFTGCNTTRRHPASNSNLKNILNNHDDKISNMSFQLKQITENNNQAIRQLNAITKQNNVFKKQITELKQNIITLKKALATEQKNRHTETEKLFKDIVQQTSEIINAQTAKMQKARKIRTAKSRIPKGSFYEYTVQKGATLGAIAKAYKVSIADIKKTNNLKNDFIRVGQKLLIPKK